MHANAYILIKTKGEKYLGRGIEIILILDG